jgi:ribosome-binding ATPase
MDRDFGLIHLIVQTWFPMRMQVFVNGHHWLANKMDAHDIGYTQCDNAFVWIEDIESSSSSITGFRPHRIRRAAFPALPSK